jgi:hypothetical protein
MRKVFAALMALVAVLALAGTAAAAITISQAPAGPGYQNLSPWTCEGRTYDLSNGPIRLMFGWGAHTRSQMTQFFKYSSGTVTITGTDTFSDSWSSTGGEPFVSQQGIRWSALEPTTLTAPGTSGQTLDGFSSVYRGVLDLAPGTYTLRTSFDIARPVQDGFGSYKGSFNNGSGCTFTVTA